MTASERQERLDRLSAGIVELRGLAPKISAATEEIESFCGSAARLGLRLLDGLGMPVSLRRHELVSIPETITLLKHVDGLTQSGVTPADMSDIRGLVASRAAALDAALNAIQEIDMIRIEPGVDLGLTEARIDPQRAVAAFLSRMGHSLPAEIQPDLNEDIGGALFSDYVSADLPQEEREESAARIKANPVLKRYTHDELIIVAKLRHIILKLDQYGFGIPARRRPMFSRARRNILWSVPRVGMIMVTHLPSWHRNDDIGKLLLDLRRYEQHMNDMAMVPEDDDWFTRNDPLAKALRQDAWSIHQRGTGIVQSIGQGPSAYRFDEAFFDLMPGKHANFTQRFVEASAPLINAMAACGIGGRGERDRAMMPEEIAEAARAESGKETLLGALKDLFL
ncbi:hypothetical protein ACGYLO_11460 [Sulfitobacter sp. 1A13353]|uniref:hypothetical protein n=1 Tax=Sulfitobacter sp. 1A13353 TaxID=3368568 RepID=UPI003745F674